MANDTAYVLSSTYNQGTNSGSVYFKGPAEINPNTLDECTKDLTYAKVFDTEKEAWECNEYNSATRTWQITPISRKRLFKDKLVG